MELFFKTKILAPIFKDEVSISWQEFQITSWRFETIYYLSNCSPFLQPIDFCKKFLQEIGVTSLEFLQEDEIDRKEWKFYLWIMSFTRLQLICEMATWPAWMHTAKII